MSKKLEKLEKLATFVFLLIAAVSCSKDDDAVSSVDPAESREAPVQVMMVFAPGQLGDKGYADDMLYQLELLRQESNVVGADPVSARNNAVNVHYISSEYLDFTQRALYNWIRAGEQAERRLIVFTESYMALWLKDVKGDLRSTDEVLIMKANDEDVKDVADALGLGSRVHGLNISAAYSIRRFCRYMDEAIPLAQSLGVDLKRDVIAHCQLFTDNTMIYRDSIAETMEEVLGETSVRIGIPLVPDNNKEGETIYGKGPVNQAAYKLAAYWQDTYQKKGYGFVIVDFGSANSGWDVWLLSHWSENYFDYIKTLMIGTGYSDVISRYCVIREWGTAFMEWATDWTKKPVGAMPAATIHYGKDYCKDNLPVAE